MKRFAIILFVAYAATTITMLYVAFNSPPMWLFILILITSEANLLGAIYFAVEYQKFKDENKYK